MDITWYVIGGILVVISYAVLVFFVMLFKHRTESYKILLNANYRKCSDGYMSGTDGWYSKELTKAVERAKLELQIKEFGLAEKSQEFLEVKSKELNPVGYATPEMANWLGKEKF